MKQSKIQNFIALTAILFLLWVLLTGSLAFQELLSGLVVAAAVAMISSNINLLDHFKLTKSAPLSLLRYLYYFFVALVKANFDLARRILSPSLPINPAVVEIETKLKSDLARLLLANSITLTPGTLTIDVQKQRLLVHWVDASSGTDLQSATQAIADQFEQHINGFMK
jgi:multicomponent Na+:H+ antiporter subunit E